MFNRAARDRHVDFTPAPAPWPFKHAVGNVYYFAPLPIETFPNERPNVPCLIMETRIPLDRPLGIGSQNT